MPERTPDHSPNSRSDGRTRPSAIDTASIPKTGKPSTAASIKSFVRKTLLASPMFPGLYADVVLNYAPNSHEARILAPHYKKIIAYTERTKPMMSAKSCTHIKVPGVGCGCPALRGEQFCYFHQRMLRTVKDPASRVHHTALLEDEESIQASLMEVVNALLPGTIELKRAELILRALNTAVRNIRRVKFGLHRQEERAASAPSKKGRSPGGILRWRRQNSRTSQETRPRNCSSRKRSSAAGKPDECGYSRPRLSRRPRSIGPQRSATGPAAHSVS